MDRKKYMSVSDYREGYDHGVIDGRRQGLEALIAFTSDLKQLCDTYQIKLKDTDDTNDTPIPTT